MISPALNLVPSGTVMVLSAADAVVQPAENWIVVLMYCESVTSIHSLSMISVSPTSKYPPAEACTVVPSPSGSATARVPAGIVLSQNPNGPVIRISHCGVVLFPKTSFRSRRSCISLYGGPVSGRKRQWAMLMGTGTVRNGPDSISVGLPASSLSSSHSRQG